MALSIDDLRRMLDSVRIRYFLHPHRPGVLAGFAGVFGRYQVTIRIEDKGQFLQFRTVGYAHCPVDHPHISSVLKVLVGLNDELRLVKFGWDHTDGEITAYADLWAMDAVVTQAQFRRMLDVFLLGIDTSFHRIQQAMQTGVDPGNPGPEDVLARLSHASGPLAEELEKTMGGKKPKGDSKSPPDEGRGRRHDLT